MNQTVENGLELALANRGYWPAVAYQHFAGGHYARAAELCQRMLESEPHLISGRVILARSLYHAGQFDSAREHFLTVLRHDPVNLVALKYLGDIAFRDGEEAAAMAYYRRVLEIDSRCEGLCCAIRQPEAAPTRQLTIKRGEETAVDKRRSPIQEPAFITETVGDIYRDQGYYQLAGEVYRRLLVDRKNDRVFGKLREIEEKMTRKEKTHESSDR